MRISKLLVIVIVVMYSCQDSAETQTISQQVLVDESESNSMKAERFERAISRFKVLYAELLDFKDESSFKQFGFGAGGPHAAWLESTREFGQDADSKLLIEKGFVIGELESLGMAYVSSKGQETSETERLNVIFKRAIDSKPIETIETNSGSQEYAQLQAEATLLGKWTVTNSLAKDSYPFEIYKKGEEYIGVYPSRDFKTEPLEKKGKEFFVKGSRHAEFYRVEKNMSMALFDQDGELESSGWTAVLVK